MDDDRQTQEDIDADTIEDEVIRCARCDATLARRADGIPGDRHPVYANPAGVVFELILVSRAHGASAVSGPVLEHTWFSGYAWQIAVCHACQAHVGWHYSAVDGRSPAYFVGLVVDRVR